MHQPLSLPSPYKIQPLTSLPAQVTLLLTPASFCSNKANVMGQGRGSAGQAMALGLMLLFLMLLHSEIVESAVYTVGDRGGWTFNSAGWTKNKSFRAGDVVLFKYDPSIHNVVAVNAAGYNGCTTPKGSKIYKSGNDRVTLARGSNYFICNFPGHCEGGMKLLVNAA